MTTNLTADKIPDLQSYLSSNDNNIYKLYYYPYFTNVKDEDAQNLKAKLEEFYINPLLIYQITNGTLVYNSELVEFQSHGKETIPPQIRQVVDFI